jgi:hypothetical protein
MYQLRSINNGTEQPIEHAIFYDLNGDRSFSNLEQIGSIQSSTALSLDTSYAVFQDEVF